MKKTRTSATRVKSIVYKSKGNYKGNYYRYYSFYLNFLDITLGIVLLLETILACVKTTGLVTNILKTVTLALYLIYYEVLMIFISLDRSVCVLLNIIKYNYYVTFSCVKNAIAIFWLVGLCSTVPTPFFNTKKIVDLYIKMVFHTLDCIFIVMSLITYSMVGLKLKNSNLQFASSTGRNKTQNFIVPFLIILSFSFCFVIPDILHIFFYKLDVTGPVVRFILLLNYFNVLLDPLIYIFTTKTLRENAFTTLHCNVARD